MRTFRGKVARLGAIGAATLIGVAGLGAAGLFAATSAGGAPSPGTATEQYFGFPGPTGFSVVNTIAQPYSPATASPGSNFTVTNQGGSQVVPTTNSGVPVNYISNNAQYYEIPAGSTYVSSVVSGPLTWTGGPGTGGIPASGSGPVSAIECLSAATPGCTAALSSALAVTGGVYSGFAGPNPTYPYLEVTTGATQIPAGATLVLPDVTVTLTASGAVGSTINWSQFEFDTAANVTLFGTSLTALVVGYPTASSFCNTVPNVPPVTGCALPAVTTSPFITYSAPPVLTSTNIVAVPGAPTIGTATAGNASATVTWTAPASNGGSAITGYVITPSSGSSVTVGNVTSDTVTGLTNGTAYTFKVAAINAVGTGPQSAASNSVTPTAPATVPGAPTIGTATAGNASATVTWTAPASNGGSAITGYVITPSSGSSVTVGNVTSDTVTGLTNGTAYTFKVAAINAVGTGPQSAASNSVTPTASTAKVPGAPTHVVATAGNASAKLTWTAPASNGGSAITGYLITPYLWGKAQKAITVGNVTSFTVTGLHNWNLYNFTVAAINGVGTGSASAPSNFVIPPIFTFWF